jgi:hypothetical protein
MSQHLRIPHFGLVQVSDEGAVHGLITAELFGPNGALKTVEVVQNLITDSGDLYHCGRIAAGIGTPNLAQPTLVTGMKLGTGSTAAAKNGTGASIVTYVGSITANKIFDTTHPQVSNLGAGLGVQVVYKVTWAAGQATNSALRECVIVTDAATDATSSAANTISRGVFGSAIDKQSGDTLVVTWNHKQLGA